MKKYLWCVILLCPLFVFSQEIDKEISEDQKSKIIDVVKIWMDNMLATKNQKGLRRFRKLTQHF